MNETQFYTLLGSLVFGGSDTLWKTFSAEEREDLCRLALQRKLGTLFYRRLYKELPEPYAQEFGKLYRAAAARAMLELAERKRLFDLLAKERIRFAPIKGLDLAFRLYPDSALRPHVDWDILFHPDDIQRARLLLEANGWKPYGQYRDSNPGEHHFEPLYRHGLALEPHWTLPNVSNLTPRQLWENLKKDESGIYLLPPEWNLLLLIAHATSIDFRHVPPWKLLPDAGFLLQKEATDWGKVRELATRHDVFSPDLFLGAWMEFFPAGMLPPEAEDPEAAALIHALGGAAHRLTKDPYEQLMNKPEKISVSWFKKRLNIYLHPHRMLRKYGIRKNSVPLFLWCVIKDFCGKTAAFFHFLFRKDPGSRSYYTLLDDLHALDCKRKSVRGEKA